MSLPPQVLERIEADRRAGLLSRSRPIFTPRWPKRAPAPPTRRQIEVLRTIQEHSKSHGFAPTIRELGDQLGISSTNGVNCHLQLLERKGLLTRRARASRTIQLTPAGRRAVG